MQNSIQKTIHKNINNIQLPNRPLKIEKKENGRINNSSTYEFHTDHFDSNFGMSPPNFFMDNLKKRMTLYHPSSVNPL
jgi:hypothetical protein